MNYPQTEKKGWRAIDVYCMIQKYSLIIIIMIIIDSTKKLKNLFETMTLRMIG